MSDYDLTDVGSNARTVQPNSSLTASVKLHLLAILEGGKTWKATSTLPFVYLMIIFNKARVMKYILNYDFLRLLCYHIYYIYEELSTIEVYSVRLIM
jgi:hypothetical protein